MSDGETDEIRALSALAGNIEEDSTEAAPVELTDGLQGRRRLVAIVSLSIGTLLLMLDASIANVALPTIAHQLHVPESQSVLIVVVYNLVLGMTLLPLATLGMHIGLRRLFLAGLAVYMIGALLSWFAHSFAMLLAVRSVQALGSAAALSVGSALVRATYPRNQLGRGLGLNTLAAAVGAASAPVASGLIISHASWHFLFIAGVPLALLAFAAGRYLPDPQIAARHFDKLGAVLCAITFGLLISGLRSLSASHSFLLPAGQLLLSAGAGFLLVRHETGQTHPVLPVDLLKRPALAFSVGAGLCGYLASTCLLLALPFRLHDAGFSPGEIGEVIMPYAAAATISAPVAGTLSDRISPTILGVAGLVIAAISLLLLAHFPERPTHLQVILPMALSGIGFGMFMSPNARLVIGAVQAERAASASSLISTTRMMAQAAGSTLVGALLAFGVWPSAPLIGTGLCVTALGLTLARHWAARAG